MPIENPMEFVQMIANQKDPKQMVFSMLEQSASNNPFFANLLTLAKENRQAEIENIARNMMKERGLDFDKEFNSFRALFKL